MGDCSCDIADWLSELPYVIAISTRAIVLALKGDHEEAINILNTLEKRLHEIVAGGYHDYSE